MRPFWHHLLTGLTMGAADAVPGVSGGTVALLCGIYTRLVKAVTQFNTQLLKLILQRQWLEAARQADLLFLLPLGGGIAGGLVLSSLTVKRLLAAEVSRPLTLAWFCGMILASAWILWRTTESPEHPRGLKYGCGVLLGTALAATLGLVTALSHSSQPSLLFTFICGTIAICAMILPGISGAMILQVLGIYYYLISIPDELIHGDRAQAATVVAVFALGCGLGLGGFSRLLTWLLKRHEQATLSILLGLMLGSVVQLWPFQLKTFPPGADSEHPHWIKSTPDLLTLEPWLCMVTFAVGVGVILGARHLAVGLAKRDHQLHASESVNDEDISAGG